MTSATNFDSFDLAKKISTVLIVDDVRLNQEILVELLKPYYQIKVASNGIRALEIAQKCPYPDLILLDVNMPEMDGYQVCQKLQENPVTFDIPVIFITAVTDQKSEAYGLELGAVDYISKPFNPRIVLLRVRNQILLRQSIKKLRLAATVFDNTMEGIMITDAEGNITNANPAFSRITGYSLNEVIGKNPRIFKSGRHPDEFYQQMWQSLFTVGYWQGEIWDKRKNGEIHAKFLNIDTIFDKEGKVDCYLAFFSDITARKQYEEEIKRLSESELNKAKEEAERASRAKSEFLASMSHELRTPMNAVLGFAQLLDYEELTEEQHDSVKEILAAGYHLLDLINEVLDLSKIESGKLELKLEPVELYSLINNCFSLVQPLALKDNLSMVNSLTGSETVTVIADPLHLKQVLVNLISNAIKYNRIGGSVTVACEIDNQGQMAVVKVSDTGKGLSEKDLTKLFIPFERLNAKNSSIEGTGIGLVICKKLIEAMGGKIGGSSVLGEGSCFWITIPLSKK